MTDNCSGTRELAEKRAKLAENLITLSENTDLPVESRNAALDKLAPEVNDAAQAEQRTQAEAQAAELRTVHERAGAETARRRDLDEPDSGMEWRNLFPSHEEYRALMETGAPAQGGYTVPQKVGNKWIGQLRAQSVFLAAPGINLIPFDSATFRIPQVLTSGNPSVVAEGATIPKADLTTGPVDFNAQKYGFIYQASSEILEDSAINIEQLVAQTMVENIASKVDLDAFQGNGTTGLFGISSTAALNTATTLAAGTTSVTWDHVLDAYMAILLTGRKPTVVWCSIDQFRGLVKSRENGSTGAYLAGSVTADPAGAAWGLPILPSANVPARTVIVADASRVYLGVRRDVTVKRSDEYAFGEDMSSWRATSRWAGIRVAEATSVQKIVAAAS
ncbi:phage major capsid protein [Actinoplanes subglobosus]|uniref:Phage major capsid protein n=1 Tax=Actinoplanes subglobosus TaxID=1547892 RepID=A0ABV8IYS1_9ACTN